MGFLQNSSPDASSDCSGHYYSQDSCGIHCGTVTKNTKIGRMIFFYQHLLDGGPLPISLVAAIFSSLQK